MNYECFTTYFPIKYQSPATRYEKPVFPLFESLSKDPVYLAEMKEAGERGWELVSVQPLLQGIYCDSAHASYGYSLTAGYFFFWKKQMDE